MDGQDTKWRRNIAENFNRLSRVHERYRQTTDDICEHELEFTFAKKNCIVLTDKKVQSVHVNCYVITHDSLTAWI